MPHLIDHSSIQTLYHFLSTPILFYIHYIHLFFASIAFSIPTVSLSPISLVSI